MRIDESKLSKISRSWMTALGTELSIVINSEYTDICPPCSIRLSVILNSIWWTPRERYPSQEMLSISLPTISVPSTLDHHSNETSFPSGSYDELPLKKIRSSLAVPFRSSVNEACGISLNSFTSAEYVSLLPTSSHAITVKKKEAGGSSAK